jgi:hypothetical protein
LTNSNKKTRLDFCVASTIEAFSSDALNAVESVASSNLVKEIFCDRNAFSVLCSQYLEKTKKNKQNIHYSFFVLDKVPVYKSVTRKFLPQDDRSCIRCFLDNSRVIDIFLFN